MQTTFYNAVPAEMVPTSKPLELTPEQLKAATAHVDTWHKRLKEQRRSKRDVWNECWQLYRGQENFENKEAWQARIVTPKAFSSVKTATNIIKRFLRSSGTPFAYDAINPDDALNVTRAQQRTDLTKVFMEKACWLEEFSEAIESGFIMGLGLMKAWWGFEPRVFTSVETVANPETQQLEKQLIRKEVLEGRLYLKAVDPYNFYWLPGSKLNRWTGTLEVMEVPLWELQQLAQQGIFDPELVAQIKPQRADEYEQQRALRFNERTYGNLTPNKGSDMVKLVEFYGPIMVDDVVVEKYGHMVVANDSVCLRAQANSLWRNKPPYVGFSPLAVPFRTEGVGLIEMVREVDRAISRLANMSHDTLMFKLSPIYEVTPEAYENPEDFETGIVPGKVFRKRLNFAQASGISPIISEDISQGAVAVSAALDRTHQEGAMVSEIVQAVPRYRGVQSATEIDAKFGSQQTFFEGLATDIEQQFLVPLVDLAGDLVMQFIDTATDPRVPRILGVGVEAFLGMSREELTDMVQGDYTIKASGISSQIEKAEMLQNLIQFMNIIGQSQEWMYSINEGELMKRVLEAFRPAIRDLDNIVLPPEAAAAKQQQAMLAQFMPQVISTMQAMIQQGQQVAESNKDREATAAATAAAKEK
jgi:hypothetical protein